MKVTTLHRHCTVCRPGRLQYGALHIYAALSWVTSASVDQATKAKEQQDWLSSAMQLYVGLKYWRRSHLQDSWFCNQENLWQPIFGSAAGMMMVGWRGVGCWAAGPHHSSVCQYFSVWIPQSTTDDCTVFLSCRIGCEFSELDWHSISPVVPGTDAARRGAAAETTAAAPHPACAPSRPGRRGAVPYLWIFLPYKYTTHTSNTHQPVPWSKLVFTKQQTFYLRRR